MSPTTTAAGIVLAFALLYAGYKWALPKPIPGIPHNAEAIKSPLGDIPSLMRHVSRMGDLSGWVQRQNPMHGSSISQVFIFPFSKAVLLVSDFRETRDVLLHRGKDFDRSSHAADVLSGLINKHHVTLKTGTEWKLRRRLVQDLMTPAFLHGVAAPSIYASSLRMVKLWDLKANFADGRPFSAEDDIFHVALDAVLAFSFGSEFRHSATKPQLQRLENVGTDEFVSLLSAKEEPVKFPTVPIDEVLETMLELAKTVEKVKGSPSPRMNWWFISKTPEFKRRVKLKDACIRDEIRMAIEARERHSDEDSSWVRSAVHHLVDREEKFAHREGRQPDFLSPMVVEEIFGILVAGHDTTSATVCWAVKYLADYPRVQDCLRTAVHAAFATARAEKRVPFVGEITQTSVPYLDAVMEEILRCGGTLSLIDREAVHDTVLLGHHVPKGTTVFFLNHGPGTRPSDFGVDEKNRSKRSQAAKADGQMSAWDWHDDDVDAFKPERWLASRAKGEAAAPTATDGELDGSDVVFDSQAGPNIPFGMGVRSCFGRRLAYLEFRILLTILVWNFEMLECPEELSGYRGIDGIVRKPTSCFVRLRKVSY